MNVCREKTCTNLDHKLVSPNLAKRPSGILIKAPVYLPKSFAAKYGLITSSREKRIYHQLFKDASTSCSLISLPPKIDEKEKQDVKLVLQEVDKTASKDQVVQDTIVAEVDDNAEADIQPVKSDGTKRPSIVKIIEPPYPSDVLLVDEYKPEQPKPRKGASILYVPSPGLPFWTGEFQIAEHPNADVTDEEIKLKEDKKAESEPEELVKVYQLDHRVKSAIKAHPEPSDTQIRTHASSLLSMLSEHVSDATLDDPNFYPELDIIPTVEITDSQERIIKDNLKHMDEFRNYLAYASSQLRIYPAQGLLPKRKLSKSSEESDEEDEISIYKSEHEEQKVGCCGRKK